MSGDDTSVVMLQCNPFDCTLRRTYAISKQPHPGIEWAGVTALPPTTVELTVHCDVEHLAMASTYLDELVEGMRAGLAGIEISSLQIEGTK